MSDKTKKIIDAKPIKDLAKILDELNLTEISYTDDNFSVSVSKAAVAQTITAVPAINKNGKEDNIDKDYKHEHRSQQTRKVGTD